MQNTEIPVVESLILVLVASVFAVGLQYALNLSGIPEADVLLVDVVSILHTDVLPDHGPMYCRLVV